MGILTPETAQKHLVDSLLMGEKAGFDEALNKGANIDFHYQGKNCLYHAVERDNVAMLEMVVDAGANVNFPYQNYFQRSILHLAVSWRSSLLPNLIQLTNINIECIDRDGWRPLHFAASTCYLEGMKLLLDAGAKVNAQGPHDVTPLHMVCMGKKSFRPEAAKMLLEADADPTMEAKLFGGKTVIDLARDANDDELLSSFKGHL